MPAAAETVFKWVRSHRHLGILGGVVGCLALGGVAQAAGLVAEGRALWIVASLAALVPHTVAALHRLLQRELGVDLIAVLAVVCALALGEVLAAAVLALMLASGTALEGYAEARAGSDLKALLERVPRVVHLVEGSQLRDVSVDQVSIGDLILVKPGETVPVDGVLSSAQAVLDESALTGEARPVTVGRGQRLRSGGINAGPGLEIHATTTAETSTYAAILRLVRQSQEAKAPIVRLADRFAGWFLALTLGLAGMAWFLSGDTHRALAVLVVATPCPLILAAPAAIVAGMSRAARNGILIKNGTVLETLARAQVLLMDKTGTLTAGHPIVMAVDVYGPGAADQLLRVAASLDQLSTHPFASALLDEAARRQLTLTLPSNTVESPGTGIEGRVEGHVIRLGKLSFANAGAEYAPGLETTQLRTAVEGASAVYVATDGRLSGAIVLQDPMRPEAPRVLRTLRAEGIRSIQMVSGDHPDIAEVVGDAAGVDKVYSERSPEDKVDVVRTVLSQGVTLMVGDGVNDAPALALAHVGIAIGSGAAAAAESAGVILLNERLEALVLAVRLAKRSRIIALESIGVGMGLSLLAMAAAALGWVTPIAGAILQEAIDVAVILNALRALGGGGLVHTAAPADLALSDRLDSAHRALRPRLDEIAALAAQMDSGQRDHTRDRLMAVDRFLTQDLLPHEREEQATAYPRIAAILQEEDPTGPLIHTHNEIARLARLFGRMVRAMPPEGPTPSQMRDFRRALYGLHAVLQLHFSQEEELYRLFNS